MKKIIPVLIFGLIVFYVAVHPDLYIKYIVKMLGTDPAQNTHVPPQTTPRKQETTQGMDNPAENLFSGGAEGYKYVSKVENNSPDMLRLALRESSQCKGEDRTECRMEQLFYYVQNNIPYVPEPDGPENVQTPEETLAKGGDCEDQSILLASLLSHVSLKPYLVIVPGHMYVMACGLGASTGVSDRYNPAPTQLFDLTDKKYYAVNLKNTTNIRITASSGGLFDMIAMRSANDLDRFKNRLTYESYPECSVFRKASFTIDCKFPYEGTILLFRANTPVSVRADIFSKKENLYKIYHYNGMKCVMLDASYKGNAVTMGMEMPKYLDFKKRVYQTW
ncbi:MAG: hypothetical protein AB7E96_11550 [Deferribacterales bacterium]